MPIFISTECSNGRKRRENQTYDGNANRHQSLETVRLGRSLWARDPQDSSKRTACIEEVCVLRSSVIYSLLYDSVLRVAGLLRDVRLDERKQRPRPRNRLCSTGAHEHHPVTHYYDVACRHDDYSGARNHIEDLLNCFSRKDSKWSMRLEFKVFQQCMQRWLVMISIYTSHSFAL